MKAAPESRNLARSQTVFSSLVVIDAAVPDADQLVQGAAASAEIVVLDGDRDGVEQITEILKQRLGLASLHLVSHGAPGCLVLGNRELNLSSLEIDRPLLQSWRSALLPDAAILLYGCQVAAGDAGAEFVERLHQITGVPIAASRMLTGNSDRGGNWNLEVVMGAASSRSLPPIAFDASVCAAWAGVLAQQPSGEPIVLSGGGAEWIFANNLGTEGRLGESGSVDGSPAFGINSARLTSSDANLRAIDNGLLLFVDDQPFAAGNVVDLTGNTLTVTGRGRLTGMNVTAQYYADPNLPILRTWVTFTNTFPLDLNIPVTWVSNLGTDDRTTIIGSGSGDLIFDASDNWVITDDGDNGLLSPATTSVLFGPGAVQPSLVSNTVFDQSGSRQGLLADYTINIPRNQTRSLLFFTALNSYSAFDPLRAGSETNAIDQVNGFNSVDSLRNTGLLTGLTEEQLRGVMNWRFVPPAVSITPTEGLVTSERGDTATFTLALNVPPLANVTVNLTSSNRNEGTVPAAIVFTPDNWSTPRTVTITGVDDSAADGDIAYTIQTSIASNDRGYAALNLPDIAVVNRDDNETEARVAIGPTTNLVTTEAGGMATVTVSLNQQPTAAVSVNFTSSNPSEGQVPGSITFTPQNWNQPQQVMITGVADGVIDGDMAYTIFTSVTSADSRYAGQKPPDLSVVNLDNGLGRAIEDLILIGTAKDDRLNGKGGNDLLRGLGGNDRLMGNNGDDLLEGGRGRDQIFGGPGSDRFLFAGRTSVAALSTSGLKTLERIHDFRFSQGDRLELDFDRNPDTASLPRGLFNAGKIQDAESLSLAAAQSFRDKDQRRPGNQSLGKNEALFFRLGSRTYLAVNDRSPGFSNRDLLVDVTQIQFKPGDDRLGTLRVSDYFT